MPTLPHWKRLGTVEDAVVAVVGDHYGRYGHALEPTLDLRRDLLGDDLDILEIVMTLEELFAVPLQPLAPLPTTVADLVALCRPHVEASSPLQPNKESP